VRRRSFTNWPLGLSDCPLAWFLKIRSAIRWSALYRPCRVENLPSSQRFLTANDPPLAVEEPCPKAACRFIKGLAVAISASRMEAFAAFASWSLKVVLNKGDNQQQPSTDLTSLLFGTFSFDFLQFTQQFCSLILILFVLVFLVITWKNKQSFIPSEK
jgi:hypothetical protein